MLRSLFSGLIACTLAPLAIAQETIPEPCLAAMETSEQFLEARWMPCYEAAEPQTGIWYLAVINLGTAAFQDGDYETAASFYTLSNPETGTVKSDVMLHANRAYVFHKVGDSEAALVDAAYAWGLVKSGSFGMGNQKLPEGADFYVLTLILEALYSGSSASFQDALETYQALEPTDVYDRANRAAILSEVGFLDEAIIDSAKVLEELFDDAGVLNNHCDMLVRANRALEALQFCEKSVTLDPNQGFSHHSLSTALAKLGRCSEADISFQTAVGLTPSAAFVDEGVACEAGE